MNTFAIDIGLGFGPTPIIMLTTVLVLVLILAGIFLLLSQVLGGVVDKRWPADQALTPDHQRHRRPSLPQYFGSRPHRRGEGPPLLVAVLAPHPTGGTPVFLRQIMVRACSGGTGRGLRQGRRVAKGLFRD